MAYSPYAHIGFGISLTEKEYRKLVDDDTGECKAEGLTIGFIGDCRGGFEERVLVLGDSYVETSYGPDIVELAVIKKDVTEMRRKFDSLLATVDHGMKKKKVPRWLIWASIV